MRIIIKILAFCLLAQAANAQCDTTGILLELQATTNISGILLGQTKCLKQLKLGTGLTLSNDTLRATGGGSGTVTSVAATAPAAGFTISGSPITTSGTLTFSLANDLAALEALSGTGIIARTASETYALRTITAGTGISIADGSGVSGNPTITNTGDLSATNEIQQIDTFTIVSNVLRASLSSDGVPFKSVDLSPYVNVATDLTFTGASSPYTLNSSTGTDVTLTQGSGITITRSTNDLSFAATDASTTNEVQTYAHTGTTSYTNTLSLGGGSFTLQAAGILAISHTAGTVTLTATEVDGSTTNELQTIANTSNATSHTATLSNTGGSVQLVEGTGISLTTTGTSADGIVTIASTGGTNYQTFRDDGVDKPQRAAANFVSSVRIAAVLTDDAANGETEVSTDLVLNSVADAYLSTRGALTVMGRASNSTGNVADIVSSADGQVLRRNGTTLDWGTVVTAGITNNAVTYAKMQTAASDNILLGNNNGANTAFEEITPTAAQTMLGYIDGNLGGGGRVAYSSDANTLTAEAAFLYDATNDRLTINCATPGLGAGAAILNLANVGTDVTGEFIRMAGSIDGNMLAGMYNSSTTANDNTIFTISQAGNTAGNPLIQLQISGTGGNTASIGLKNTDVNKFMISPNANDVGANANASLVATNDAIPLWGINKDAPAFPLDVSGKERADQYHGASVAWGSGDVFFGLGAGTAPTFTAMTGTNNWVRLLFKTGTSPTANNVILSVVRKAAYEFGSKGFPVFCAGNAATANEITKFYMGSDNGVTWNLVANGTLTALTDYEILVCFSGY